MKKGIKITIATISVFGISGLIYWLYNKSVKDKISSSLGGYNEKDNTVFTPVVSPTSKTDNFPLKYGSRGERVKDIQKLLNKLVQENPSWGLSLTKKSNGEKLFPLGTDGIWGKDTEQAVNLVPKVPNEINEATYNSLMKYSATGYVAKRKKVYRKHASGHKNISDFGAKKQIRKQVQNAPIKRDKNLRGNRHERILKHQMKVNKFVDRLFDNLFGSDFKNQKLFDELERLPENEFIEVNNLFNERNLKMGNQRTLAYEIRGTSTIDEENLLNRFDELNLS